MFTSDEGLHRAVPHDADPERLLQDGQGRAVLPLVSAVKLKGVVAPAGYRQVSLRLEVSRSGTWVPADSATGYTNADGSVPITMTQGPKGVTYRVGVRFLGDAWNRPSSAPAALGLVDDLRGRRRDERGGTRRTVCRCGCWPFDVLVSQGGSQRRKDGPHAVHALAQG
jgi:hypothetical protein